MNDDLMFDYLLQMGAMRPEQDELKRKQAMVDALRKTALTPMQGEMVGKHYVAPGLAQAAAQLGTAYFANQGQQGVDQSMQGMNARQAQMLDELRKRRKPAAPMNVQGAPVAADPYAQFSYGNEA
jgi:hypothetical protein